MPDHAHMKHADLSSSSSSLSHGLSLGSLSSPTNHNIHAYSQPSGSSRVPSTSSQSNSAPSSAPLATPSPPGFHNVTRRKTVERQTGLGLSSLGDLDDEHEDPSINLLDTPGDRQWDDIATGITPRPNKRATRTSSSSAMKGSALTLRDQEKHIDTLKKENFNLKLRVHFLEERMAQLAPDQIDSALKQNITLKINLHERTAELKKQKKLLLEMEKEMIRLQRLGPGSASVSNQPSRLGLQLEKEIQLRDREINELRRRLSEDRNQEDIDEDMRALDARNVELEDEIENLRGLLEDNVAEIARLQELAEDRDVDSHALDDLRNQIAAREDEKEELADEVDALRLALEDAEDKIRRKDAEEHHNRSASRTAAIEDREEREAVEDEVNALRDRLAASVIEMQQKEDELDVKNEELEEMVKEHDRIVQQVEEEWREEVVEARGQVDELRDVIAERDAECKELRLQIPELEAQMSDMHAKFEQALAHQEDEAAAKDEEIEAANAEIARLGEQVYQLEEEGEHIREEIDRVRDEEGSERERLQEVVAALKVKIAELKAQLQEVENLYEQCSRDVHTHRERQEELAQHIEGLVAELTAERSALLAVEQEHETQMRREKRHLDAKDSALSSALADLGRTQALLAQREQDLNAVTEAEREAKRQGEDHTSARFGLQLEVDRLKRDVSRLEADLERERKDALERDARARDRENALDKMHADNRDLASQLAAQTQARLNVSEKLDGLQGGFRSAESELASYKSRVSELEGRLSKDQRALLSAETQYRDQLTERNTLLLTIYQYMDKILGVDKTPKKTETKPFTNFSVFHDNLISRLKSLSQIELDFDKRCKESETRFMDRLNDMRKQLDQRWRQIDKFETSVKAYADAKATWRRKFTVKEGELEAIKAMNADLVTQLASLKRAGGPADAMETRALSARATNAERRLINAQNQLAAAEEKLATSNQRTVNADGKWEARVKEYDARLKAAEERVKRERQGGKERVAELENNVKSLQRQFEVAQKRNQQLSEVLETNKVPTSPR